METERFETGKTPYVTITDCQGDLAIGGWKRSTVEISGSEFAAGMAEFDHITVSAASDVSLKVPSGSFLVLEKIGGTTSIKHVDGHITLREGIGDIELNGTGSVIIQTARGNVDGEQVDGPITLLDVEGELNLASVGDTQLKRAHHGVRVDYVRGFVDVGHVDGSLSLHTVSGDLSVVHCGGDVLLSNLGGSTRLQEVGGAVRLQGGLSSGKHSLKAAGNIIVLWPVDAPLTLTAGGSSVSCLLPLEGRVETVAEDRMTLVGHLEEGKTRLNIDSAQRVGIKPIYASGGDRPESSEFDFDFETPESEPSPEAVPTRPVLADVNWAALLRELSSNVQDQLNQLGVQVSAADIDAAIADAVEDLAQASSPGPALTEDVTSGGAVDSAGVLLAEKAKQAVERSLDKAEQSMDKARRQIQGKAKPGKPAAAGKTKPGKPAASGKTKAAPVQVEPEKMASEEQLQILKLLKEGHISVKQADTLLKALDP